MLEARRALQRVLERLDQWNETSFMGFNKAKCQVLSSCPKNPLQCSRVGQSGWKAPSRKGPGGAG